jgi:hypothetical protein
VQAVVSGAQQPAPVHGTHVSTALHIHPGQQAIAGEQSA